MELKEVYEKLGGDYDDVVRRLMGEKLVRKFLLKFLDDKSYADLERTLSEGDYKEAFRAAHTLKGVAANMGLVLPKEGFLSALPEPVTDKPLSGEQPAYRGIEK